jgi:hypothetical protein
MTQATWVLGPIQTRNFRPIVADPGSGAFLAAGSGIRIRDLGWKKIRIRKVHFFSQ